MQPLVKFKHHSDLTASEIAEHADWIVELTDTDVAEVETALQKHLDAGTPYPKITKAEFSLPHFSRKLSHAMDVINDGMGATILRGLPVDKYQPDEIKKMIWGIGLHLGTMMGQSSAGERISDLKDEGLTIGEPNSRYINSKGSAALHNDACDLLAMLVIANAEHGGESLLASSVAVHNEMLVQHPDLLAVLYQPLYFKIPDWYESEARYYPLPVFSNHNGHFVCTHARYLIEDAQKHTDAPRLTDQQKQALDCLDAIYNSDKFKLSFKLQAGDMIIINDWLMVHGRNTFTDAAQTKRHLLRLWMSHPNSPELPSEYAIPYTHTEPGSQRIGKLLVKW